MSDTTKELYALIEQAKIERDRLDRVVEIVGNIICGSLALMVGSVIVRWLMI